MCLVFENGGVTDSSAFSSLHFFFFFFYNNCSARCILTIYTVISHTVLVMSAGKFYWSEDKSDQATWVLSCQYASSEVLWGAPTISVTVRNWWSNVHTHFTPWLASGAEVKKKELVSLDPFFHCWHNYFSHFLCEQLSATLRLSSRRDYLDICTVT